MNCQNKDCINVAELTFCQIDVCRKCFERMQRLKNKDDSKQVKMVF